MMLSFEHNMIILRESYFDSKIGKYINYNVGCSFNSQLTKITFSFLDARF
jgi:hypothetical protein